MRKILITVATVAATLALALGGASAANAAPGDSQANPIVIKSQYAFQYCADEGVGSIGVANGVGTQPTKQRFEYSQGEGSDTFGFSTGLVGGVWYALEGGTWIDVDGEQRSVLVRTEVRYTCDNLQTINGPLTPPTKNDNPGTANDSFTIPPVEGAEGRVLTLASNKIRVQYYALDGYVFAPGTTVAWQFAPFSTK